MQNEGCRFSIQVYYKNKKTLQWKRPVATLQFIALLQVQGCNSVQLFEL